MKKHCELATLEFKNNLQIIKVVDKYIDRKCDMFNQKARLTFKNSNSNFFFSKTYFLVKLKIKRIISNNFSYFM